MKTIDEQIVEIKCITNRYDSIDMRLALLNANGYNIQKTWVKCNVVNTVYEKPRLKQLHVQISNIIEHFGNYKDLAYVVVLKK